MAKLAGRWAAAWRDVAVSTVAAALAWLLAQHLLGHSQPIFAAIAAVVCLAPGLPSHGRQAVGMAGGVTVGVTVGAVALHFPDLGGIVDLMLTTAAAMMLAATFDFGAVMVIQAAASAIIVVGFGHTEAGLGRVGDAAVGAAIGLLFSQLLLTPNPLPGVDRAARRLLAAIAGLLATNADAIALGDEILARRALADLMQAHDALRALEDALGLARRIARWTVRGRLARASISEAAAAYDRRGVQLFSYALLFGDTVANALSSAGDDGPSPAAFATRVRALATSCAALAS